VFERNNEPGLAAQRKTKMQNYSSPNYAAYVTSTDDKAGMQKAHFFDLFESMIDRSKGDDSLIKIEDYLRNQPSSYFTCESVNKSVVAATLKKAAQEVGLVK
jgi:hypothetical protein